MTHEEKINYMRIATGIAGFCIKNEHLDLLVSLYELTMQKKGKTHLDEIVEVELEVKKRADIKSKQELLDKVSDKVE
jgi:hypothetical protein